MRQQVFALRRQDSNNDVSSEPFLDDNDAEVCLLCSFTNTYVDRWTPGNLFVYIWFGICQESRQDHRLVFDPKASCIGDCIGGVILPFRFRSGKGKATKNSNEAEYRTIFDNLISDLLVVLFWPEWPAASLLLSIVCKFMVGGLMYISRESFTR
jgi:hypothetical protein